MNIERQIQRAEKNPLIQRILFDRWMDPETGLHRFAFEAVRTKDEHDPVNPIKRLPVLPHIEVLLDRMRRGGLPGATPEDRVLVVMKSRQIKATWSGLIYTTWASLAIKKRAVALVTKKQEDGEAHIEDRVTGTIWEYLPPWFKERFEVRPVAKCFEVRKRDGELWNSTITAIAQGAHQLRQFVYSIIWWDEMGVQDAARAAWKGALPTIQARGEFGGQIICTSTAIPNSFHAELCGDDHDKAVLIARGKLAADVA